MPGRSLLLALAVCGFLSGAGREAGASALERYGARQGDGVTLLDAIARSLPDGLWLDRLDLSGDQALLEGRAFNTNAIADFIEGLDRSPDFGEPVLREATARPDKVYRYIVELRFDRRARGPEEASLASRAEQPGVAERLRALLAAPGIRLLSYTPGAAVDRELRVLPVKTRIVAASYQDLYALLDRLARLSPVVALERLAVARDKDSSLAVDLGLEIPALEGGAGTRGPAASPAPGTRSLPVQIRWDPFQVLTRDGPVRLRLHPAGVPGLLVADLEVLSLFQSAKGYVAQVRTRATGKTYLVKAGDQLYDAEVLRVTATEAVLRQALGTPGATREVILRPAAP